MKRATAFALQFLLTWLLTSISLNASSMPLTLSGQPTSANGYLERLDDPNHSLSAAQALASPDWSKLPGALNAGFTYQTLWLKLTVHNSSESATHWILSLSNALLDDVRLYQPSANGGFVELRSGENYLRSQWPLNYRAAAFTIDLEPHKTQTLLLRLQSKNALTTSVNLAQEPQFGHKSRQEYLWHGLYFGVYLALIVFHTAFWLMTRADESGWYLVYVSSCLLLELFSVGLIQQGLDIPVSLSDPILGCLLALSLPLGFYFSQRQLRIQHLRGFRKAYTHVCLAVGAIAAVLVLCGHYQLGAPLVQIGSVLTIVVILCLAFWLIANGHRPAKTFLLIFGVYYLGVIVGFMRNLGIVPTHVLTDNATAIGTLLHMVLMSTRIIYYYRQMQQEKRAAQEHVKQLLQAQNHSLEEQIAERTQELRAEIARRGMFEKELRQALSQEQKIREQQRDFVAMVSHEFRTPLAIISTSAQQISRHSQGHERNQTRCNNIREACGRLMRLVSDYLSNDRLENVTHIQPSQNYPIAQLLSLSTLEFEKERVQAHNHSAISALTCDEGLIKIALRNLLANADRHAPQQSVIDLTLSDQAGFLEIRISHPGDEIPSEQARLLFQKYYRGSQAQHSPGAGLGLYIAQRIAHLHGGELVIEARGENGIICFRLSLPLAEPTA